MKEELPEELNEIPHWAYLRSASTSNQIFGTAASVEDVRELNEAVNKIIRYLKSQ